MCWGKEGELTPGADEVCVRCSGGVCDVAIFGIEGEVEHYGEAEVC